MIILADSFLHNSFDKRWKNSDNQLEGHMKLLSLIGLGVRTGQRVLFLRDAFLLYVKNTGFEMNLKVNA